MSFVLDYKDKVVLVTGVSSGIGLGVAKEFARAGAHVAGCSRKSPDDASVQAFREVVEQEGVRSFYRPADVTDAEELKGFVEDTVRTFGRIDMVVSNAGMNVFEGALALQPRSELSFPLASGPALQALSRKERRRRPAPDDLQPCFQLHPRLLPL